MVGRFPLQPEKITGGVESSSANLIEGLRTLEDTEIHLVTCSRFLKENVHVERDGVSYHYLASLGRFETLSFHALDRRKVQRELGQICPDVVHALDAHKYGYICLGIQRPTVMSIHGILQVERKFRSTTVDALRATVTSMFVERKCVKNARYIIQPTSYPEQYFGRLITGRVYTIANPIAEKFFNANGVEEEGRLLFVGQVIPIKRILDLIQALAKVRDRFPNVSLRIAGRTLDQKYLRSINECIAVHGLKENVRFLGSLTQDELLQEYKRCALLTLPSAQENSPMVIGEAMAVGKPLVATRVGGVSSLVDDGQTGFLVDVADIDALADRILTLLSDHELRFKMGKLAKEKANLNFRSKAVAARVRQVYREAIEGAHLGE